MLGDFAVDLKVLADAGAFQGACLGKHATFVFSQVRDDELEIGMKEPYTFQSLFLLSSPRIPFS